VPKRAPDLLPRAIDTQLLAAAETDRDMLALIVLLDLGLRKSELGAIMVRDFDLSRRVLTVFGKGQKERVLPLRGRIVLAASGTCSPSFRSSRSGTTVFDACPSQTTTCCTRSGERGGRVYRANPKQPMPRQTIHRWWYQHLQRAGLVAKDVERGMNMHRARHTFATELRRDAGDLGVVQRMLGHADIHTTEAFYGHYDLSDLEAAMEAFARRESRDPN
jgi:integrase/recombinase XerD